MCIYICVCVCVCVCEYYLVMRKKEILLFLTTWMGPEGVMLNEVSQTEKDR